MPIMPAGLANQADAELKSLISGAFPGFSPVGRLNKGWSSDAKYRLSSKEHGDCLLRISSSVTLKRRSETAEMMRIAISAGIIAPLPLDFGMLSDGSTYILQTWLDGNPLDEVLCSLEETEQYALGRLAGRMLADLHNEKTCFEAPDFGLRTIRRIRRKLSNYMESAARVPRAEEALQFIHDNLELLRDRPSLPQHGDFHPGNMLLNDEGHIYLIDFDRCSFGDPFEEFYKAQFFARPLSEAFMNGQVHAYFDDRVPDSFWPLFKLYVAEAAFYSPVWALPYGPEQVRHLSELSKMAVDDFGSFSLTEPEWFKRPEICAATHGPPQSRDGLEAY